MIDEWSSILNNKSADLCGRFDALFRLRTAGGHAAIDAIVRAFDDPSVLLKHELAYCLGQMQDTYALPYLYDLISDVKEDCIVRHEAGEAIGAIGSQDSLVILERFLHDSSIEVRETCQLAIGRIKHLQTSSDVLSPYKSIDPTTASEETNIDKLTNTLLDQNLSIYDRYLALFALRNLTSDDATLALCRGFSDSSALFKHEVAFVLGQLRRPICVPALVRALADQSEHPMVRHECAEALGSIATVNSDLIMPHLQKFCSDPETIVRESCEVAIGICNAG